MSINLSKGQNIDLTKSNPGVSKYRVGLGWDTNPTVGGDYDLDVSAFVLGANNKLISDGHFVFYNNLKSPNELVVHTGDNLTGQGDGDDESLVVDFSKVTNEERIVFVVTIHEAQSRNQNFGQVNNAFIRIVDEAKYNAALAIQDDDQQMQAMKDAELIKYDLGEDYSIETAMVFGELYKKDNEFKFKAVGQGMSGGLDDFLKLYQ